MAVCPQGNSGTDDGSPGYPVVPLPSALQHNDGLSVAPARWGHFVSVQMPKLRALKEMSASSTCIRTRRGEGAGSRPAGFFCLIGNSRVHPKQAGSFVRPKQYMALCIKAAFSGNESRVSQAGVVERAVPTASLPPFRPCDVIAVLAVGISRLLGRTKDASGGIPSSGYYTLGHSGSCQHRKKDCGSANQSEIRHSFLPLVPLIHNTGHGREFRPWILKDY
jgi:hypothetical protein